MLFVEPGEIGTGTGRLLYRHVLDEAARLGFHRLTTESDPNAEGFYRAVGAERRGEEARGRLPVLDAWPVPPEPAWSRAWSAGGAVLVGNVAEFNGQFGGGVRGPDHYSCLVAFCARDPALVVLPEPVEDAWAKDIAAVLGWSGTEVIGGLARDGRVSEALAADPELRERLAGALPWGVTEAFAKVGPAPRSVLAAVTRYESKARSHALFRALAPGHPGIVVPWQRRAGSRRALSRELATGAAVVLKNEYGVGGAGSLVVPAGPRPHRALARRWARDGVLVEEFVASEGRFSDPTFDAVIGADGTVHPVGAGRMDVEGTGYRGATVGPGVLPDGIAATATSFGLDVGRALAEDGYRGWFDVDFVTARSGRLAPTEINLRLTGPAVAFHLAAGLDRTRGGRHRVRTLDRLPLGARLPSGALGEHVARVTEACREVGAAFVVTIPSAAFDPAPYFGAALAARDEAALDAAEERVVALNAALAAPFAGLRTSGGGRARRRRGRLPRSSA